MSRVISYTAPFQLLAWKKNAARRKQAFTGGKVGKRCCQISNGDPEAQMPRMHACKNQANSGTLCVEPLFAR